MEPDTTFGDAILQLLQIFVAMDNFISEFLIVMVMAKSGNADFSKEKRGQRPLPN